MCLRSYRHRALLMLGLLLLSAAKLACAQDVHQLYFNAYYHEVADTAKAVYRRDYQIQGDQAQVQDFYYPSGKPYSNPYTIAAAKVAMFTPILNQGTLVLWHENGRKKMQSEFRKGRPDGTWRTWHTNGQLATSITYREGEAVGVGTRWYINGQQESQLPFRNGLANGRWQQWYPDGSLKAEMEMVDDKPTLVRRWDEQGRLTAELSINANGRQSGVVLLLHANGAKAVEIIYRDGEMVDATMWDEAGNKLAE